MKNAFWVCLIVCIWALQSCKPSEEQPSNEKPIIVATTGMLADAAKNLLKEHAEVRGLMGPGVDPHLYKPTPSDLQDLRDADVILYNGLHLESKMTEVLEKLGRGKPSLPVGEMIGEDNLHYPGGEALPDPHIWFDLSLWAEAMENLGRHLEEALPEKATVIRQNTESYVEELQKLDVWIGKKISTIPKQQRVLITAHDAFAYFGMAYDIEVKGLQGISTTAEFGLKDISDMVEFILERNIKAVFVESAISDRSIKAVVAGCQERGHEVKIGGTLYSDALGKADTEEGTFTGVVQANVHSMVESLK